MGSERISIVGIGLRYPDATSAAELWENVLAGRRAFRRLPDERMNREDYFSSDPKAPDRFYAQKAAVLRDYEFDRVKHKIAGSTFRSTDTTHWLALDVAAQALADAGFPEGEGLPKAGTGVVIGNSLTGEFSRANIMRLRWPYVRRTVAAALKDRGWDEDDTAGFLQDLELQYKSPFPEIDEDTLAGGLANTIAGRVCNHFDFAGGGFTVDGACSSSLLAVVTGANALVNRDLDVAIVGGVDLSIDPFEVIGFAKTGALAKGEMKVYDKGSNGFWPGEGSGMLVLMREADAVEQNLRIYASISGWGVSSDGKGGITRPEAAGHQLALSRAYERAGYGVETVSYFEGHGTGTALGDATEIEALSGARRQADPLAAPAALSTIKGNIGHTKAAAGVAGLIKATLAVHHQVIPPGTAHFEPHEKLTGDSARMYVPSTAELWPSDRAIRAGVSAMGFGGINSHVAVCEGPAASRRRDLDSETRQLVASRQDAELLLLDASDADQLRERVTDLIPVVAKLSMAEVTDLAGALVKELGGKPVRAAVVVTTPDDAEHKLTRLLALLDERGTEIFSDKEGLFVSERQTAPKVGFLFPGQGSGKGAVGAIRRRFPAADEIFSVAGLPANGDQVATEVAQPRIVTGSLAGLRVLHHLGIEAGIAAGHSLGELTALYWGGALNEREVVRLAQVRGKVMAKASDGGGAMAGIAASANRTEEFIRGEDVVIAGYNAPGQTVVSGPEAAVERVCARARAENVTATRINVSHAFHSPAVEPAAVAFTEHLAGFDFARLERPVVSTVSGDVLHASEELRELLRDQVVLPVRFREAAAKVAERSDLVIEVGPGRVLTGLMAEIAPSTPVLAIDTDSASLTSVLRIAAAAFALGVRVDTGALFDGRVVRPLPLDGAMTFLASPCESAPAIGAGLTVDAKRPERDVAAASTVEGGGNATLELLRKLAAERVELPLETVTADTHPLDDLHLSSITVGQLVNDVTRALGRPALEGMPNFATVCLGELAEMIDELASTAKPEDNAGGGEVSGVDTWVRPFAVDYVPAPRPPAALGSAGVSTAEWSVYSTDGHPLAEPLRDALAHAGLGDGVLLCLPEDCDDQHIRLFLDAGRATMAAPNGTRFVVVQHGLGASGLAKTLRLEDPSAKTTIVDLAEVEPRDALGISEAVSIVVSEVAATNDFTEARYELDGTRLIPSLSVSAPSPTGSVPLDETDVLLVTGGGKGITAESALALAKDSGAKLALLGRSDPAGDAELTENLARMEAAGLTVVYERADVTNAEQVRAAVARAEAALGPVTAIMHGAGRNEPAALFALNEQTFKQTVAPKIGGLKAVLDSVDPNRVKLLVTFGSIIGRAGLRGEAHYATANDWMTELTLRFGQEYPQARAVALEWSVWSGAGMGEKLGVVGALLRDGITPIPTEVGIDVLRQVLADPEGPNVVVVCGRTAGLPTLPVETAEVPLARFVDRVLVHYPGIELITEADLSAGSDPYLADHLLDGALLFPAVIGMEAMTQVSAAVLGRPGVPLLTDVEFLRPIVVPPDGSNTIRLAALARDEEHVDIVLRSADTGFSADHFRARVRLPRPELPESGAPARSTEIPLVAVDPISELYGEVLFQGKRFQRVTGYRRASARHAVAEISTSESVSWFAPFLPQEQLLADPGTRDAMMHAIQCCIPDATLLPQGIEKLYLAQPSDQDSDLVVLDARERSQDGDTYVYDLDITSPSGELVERWEGLSLRAVRKRDGAGPWVPTMLGSYLERACERVLGGQRAVVVEPDPAGAPARETAERRAQTELAASRAVDRPLTIHYRPDGKPEAGDVEVSASHTSELTLVVAGSGSLTCDMETAVARTEEDWAGLLGEDLLAVGSLLASETGESADIANTRVWSALECVRKTGAMTQALTVGRVDKDGWALLSSGSARIATWATTVNGKPDPIVFAVLQGED